MLHNLLVIELAQLLIMSLNFMSKKYPDHSIGCAEFCPPELNYRKKYRLLILTLFLNFTELS